MDRTARSLLLFALCLSISSSFAAVCTTSVPFSSIEGACGPGPDLLNYRLIQAHIPLIFVASGNEYSAASYSPNSSSAPCKLSDGTDIASSADLAGLSSVGIYCPQQSIISINVTYNSVNDSCDFTNQEITLSSCFSASTSQSSISLSATDVITAASVTEMLSTTNAASSSVSVSPSTVSQTTSASVTLDSSLSSLSSTSAAATSTRTTGRPGPQPQRAASLSSTPSVSLSASSTSSSTASVSHAATASTVSSTSGSSVSGGSTSGTSTTSTTTTGAVVPPDTTTPSPSVTDAPTSAPVTTTPSPTTQSPTETLTVNFRGCVNASARAALVSQLERDTALHAGRLREVSFSGCQKRAGGSMQIASNGQDQRADLIAADNSLSRQSNSSFYSSYGIVSHFITGDAKKKRAPLPIWVFAAIGGVALLLAIAIIVIVVLVVKRKSKKPTGSDYLVDYVMMLERKAGSQTAAKKN